MGSMTDPKLQLVDLAVSFPGAAGPVPALAPLDLSVAPGRFVSVIGPSGCGKSTLFNVVAGLLAPTRGRVLIDGVDATGHIGLVSYMLQKDLLLPWRSVLDNVILGLEIRGVPAKAARDTMRPLLKRYGLGGYEDAYPSALSGGMRQRAALLRTLVVDTDLILLDEPFGALDVQTKARMQDWLLEICSDLRKTILFVTHDIEEALYLADEVYVMGTRPGRIIHHVAPGFPRPRRRAFTTDPDFLALKTHCVAMLGETPDAVAAA